MLLALLATSGFAAVASDGLKLSCSRHGELTGMTQPWRHVRPGSGLGVLATGHVPAEIAPAGCRQPQSGREGISRFPDQFSTSS